MKTNGLRVSCCLVLIHALAGLCFEGAIASSGPEIPLEDMVRGAHRIVIGEVTSVEARWDLGGRFIWTFVTLETQQVLKGQATGSELTIRVMGGKIGETALAVSETPTFSKGEKVLVFLHENTTGLFDVFNWQHGKFSFVGDKLVRMGKEEPLSLIQTIKGITGRQ